MSPAPTGPTTPPTPRISVVLMAFNEAATLAAVTAEIHGALALLGASHELLIIDDGSSDGTGAVADRMAVAFPGVRVHHHEANLGLGGVYRTGFAQARGDLVTFFPADGQFPATIIGRYLAAIDDADLILGTLPERGGPVAGRLLSLAERLLLRGLFGHFPHFQGIIMFRRSLLDRTRLVSQGRGWTVLMGAHLAPGPGRRAHQERSHHHSSARRRGLESEQSSQRRFEPAPGLGPAALSVAPAG